MSMENQGVIQREVSTCVPMIRPSSVPISMRRESLFSCLYPGHVGAFSFDWGVLRFAKPTEWNTNSYDYRVSIMCSSLCI